MTRPLHGDTVLNLSLSDLAHVFRTNDPPSAPEAAALQHEVDALAPMVSSLRAQLREAEERLLLCKTALSPIRRVPQEILSQIINFVVGMLKGEEERHDALIRFGRVCNAWNAAAHDPSHWAEETLVLADRRSSSTVEDIEGRFKNAGDFPRTVTFHGDGCTCGDPTQRNDWVSCDCEWRIAITSFICRSAAIKRLVLTQLSFRCLTNLMASHDGISITESQAWLSIPSMALVLRSFGRTPQPTASHVFDFFDLPTSLTSLSLALNLPPHPAEVTTGLVFNPQTLENLTFLSVWCGWDTPDILRTLQSCQNLQSLVLDFYDSPQSWTDDIRDVVLPSLRALDITISKATAASRVLPCLILPALSSLRLFVSFRHDDVELMRRLTQLKVLSPEGSSTPSLRSLTLYSSTVMGLKRKISADVLLDIFSNIPSLHHFTLDNIYFDAQRFVEVLRQKIESNSPDILPSIRSVRLLDIDGNFDVFDIDAFLQFAVLRRRPSLKERDPELRAIIFGYSDWKLAKDYSFEKQQQQYELASGTIGLLKESYGVAVDRVFLSNRGY